jgi:WD repeat-containing protein 70
MATGGLDYHVRLWDFHGMNRNMNSFRIVEPFTGNAIRNLSFNTSGSHLMIVNGNKQITFLDRDGARNLLTVKGYMGHTNTINDGQFHPLNNNDFATASADGSIRLWDIEQKLEGIEKELGSKALIRAKEEKGNYIGIQSLCYSQDGNKLLTGCADGSLQIFSVKHNHHRP